MKKENWQVELFDFIENYDNAFEFGTSDCFQFSSKAIEVQTGVNVAKDFEYSSEKQALRILKKINKDSFTDLITERFTKISKNLARRGDIVSVQHDGAFGVALAVCVGDKAMGMDVERGLVVVDMSDAIEAWRID